MFACRLVGRPYPERLHSYDRGAAGGSAYQASKIRSSCLKHHLVGLEVSRNYHHQALRVCAGEAETGSPLPETLVLAMMLFARGRLDRDSPSFAEKKKNSNGEIKIQTKINKICVYVS